MPTRYSYDYVKKYIESKECELISEKYINSSEKLKIKCKCGNMYERDFYHFSKGQIECLKCKKNKFSNRYRTSFDEIINKINQNDCEYIAGEYVNNKSKLTLKCKCGNIFTKDMAHFFNGQNRCPECGKNLSSQYKIKYDENYVQDIISKNGYILKDKYINAYTPFKVMCKNGHEFNMVFSHYLNNHSGCKQCANRRLNGKGHWNYKGGESEVLDYFRKNINQWKFDVFKRNNFKCFLTGSDNDCVVHHLKSFNLIISESCQELNIKLERKIKDYDAETFEKLKNKVFSKHTINEGIVLQRKVHNKFHSIYGLGNNTNEQFEDFVSKHYPKKLYFLRKYLIKK